MGTIRFGWGLAAALLAAGPAAAQSISVVNSASTPVNAFLYGREAGLAHECGRLGVLLANQTGSFTDQSVPRCGPTQTMEVDIHRPGSAAGAPTTCWLTGITWGRTITVSGTATAITCIAN